ncbi:hypothetical protein SEVIR_3G367901v4 [Setaria viridis]
MNRPTHIGVYMLSEWDNMSLPTPGRRWSMDAGGGARGRANGRARVVQRRCRQNLHARRPRHDWPVGPTCILKGPARQKTSGGRRLLLALHDFMCSCKISMVCPASLFIVSVYVKNHIPTSLFICIYSMKKMS